MTGLLSAAVRATGDGADPDVLLDRVARLLVGPADWVLADRLEEPDLVVRVAAHGRAGQGLPGGGVPRRGRRSAAGSVGLLPRLARAPDRLLRLSADDLDQLAAAPEPHLAGQARGALSLGTRDLVLAGLVARDRLLGVLTVGSSTRLDDAVVAELADVARHVGTALDAARLLAASRVVATAMQTSLLPPVPHVPGLRLAARYAPAARELDVGGDWYDAFPAGDGLVVVVGDVRGHDLVAASQMADLRNLLRAHAVDRDEPPSALLARLERTTEALSLEVAATCVVGRLAPQADGRWRLTWSSAGHLPPVHVHDGRAVLLDTEPDLMLGVQGGSRRADAVRTLAPGDVVVLCTDGLVEVREESLTTRLEVLRALVEEHAGASADALAEALLALAPDSEDDVALLVVQVTG